MTTVNLNGETPFSLGTDTHYWGDRFNESIYFGSNGHPAVTSIDMTLSGAVWRIPRMGFDSEFDATPIDLSITDTNDGIERRIDWLSMFELDDVDITLHGSRVRYFVAGDCDTLTLNLGAGRLKHADIFNTDATVTLGSGSVGQIRIDGGSHVIRAGSGWLDTLSIDNAGTVAFTDGTGYFGTVRSEAETGSFTIRTGGNSLILNAGVNSVEMTGGSLGAIVGYSRSTNSVIVRTDAELDLVRFSGNNDRVEVRGGKAGQLHLGEGGNTFLQTAGRTDVVAAGNGDDRFTIEGGEVGTLNGGGGNNRFVFTSKMKGFIDSVISYRGNDRLEMQGGDLFSADLGHGNNVVTIGGTGQVQALNTLNGDDTITLTTGKVGKIDAGSGNNTITTGTRWTESITTRDGADRITVGSGKAGTIDSGAGNDVVDLRNGRADYVATSDGDDRVQLGSLAAMFVDLGNGDDTISLAPFNPEWGVQILGGSGSDTIDFSGFTRSVRFDLSIEGQWQNVGGASDDADPVAGYVAQTWVENVTGGKGADRLTGNGSANTLSGGAGNDRLFGGGGNDILDDGPGTDYVDGGSGIDTFQRNLSQDYDDYAFTTVVDLTAGKFYAVGYENDFDTLVSIENVDMKGNFDDRIYGTSGKNTLRGNNGNDFLYGQSGNDVLYGGNNNDKLYGGAGNDTLIGGAGRDWLEGGGGADRFVFERAGDAGKGASRDVILDFSRREGDRIDLKAIDARSGTSADNAFVFIGSKGFSKTAGELRYDRAKKLVQADTNGDGRADFELRIDNGAALDAGDFIL